MATIQRWDPEDKAFWEKEGKKVAGRNLRLSVPALLLAFAVWMVWSVVVVNLPNIGFQFTTDQLFWLTALPGLSGATLRIFYSFMVPIFGGRNWTALSTASLLLPALGMGFAVQDPATPYGVFLVLALLCGFGGGNFASSMANISFFFPKAQKGTALGINAGLGNLGVSVVQFVVPMVIWTPVLGLAGSGPQTWVKGEVAKQIWLQNAGFFWVPFIVASSLLAWILMDNLATAKASFKEQSVIFRRKHNWIMSWLYVGTFGSFIGYSAGFPLLIKTQFPDVNPLTYAWMGPFVGALIRPFGGWISDKLGGARVTFWNFLVMIGAVFAVLFFLKGHFFPGFLASFILLFLTTGIGNGSTFRMIPIIFLNERLAAAGPGGREQALKDAAKESAAVLGFTSAVAAYGAFIIPKSYGFSIAQTGGPQGALYGFIAFYVVCVALTWWYYSRKGAEAPC
jgi:NNP family nitrate/nitrite transporter-like MFS transporter